MSRSGTESAVAPLPVLRRRLAALAVVGLTAPLAAGAVEVPPDPVELELTPEVRSELARLQESWIDWLSTLYQDDPQAAERALLELQSGAGRVGLHRLPDLSLGAAAQAVRAAEEGAFERAEMALAAAERLDPSLAEPEFARALVARERGGRSLAALSAIRHLIGSPLLARLSTANLSIWFLAALLLAGIGFVAVEMATRGRVLVARIFGWLQRHLPPLACYVLTILLLVWPLLLPSGPLLLVVYWAILLWGLCRYLERVVLAALILLLGLAPVLIDAQREQLSLALAAPARAVEDVRSSRLGGRLFSDLGILRAILPDSPAVQHLLADVHAELGQWPLARDLYTQVIESEAQNLEAHVDAGVCLFQLGDFEAAIELFRRAAVLDPESAAAHFNLSQTYSELLRFDESARALQSAQRLASRQVGRWLRESAESRVIPVQGGLNRAAEIREQMAAAWRSGQLQPSWYLSLPLALLFVVIAALLHLVLRRAGKRAVRPGESEERPVLGRWARAFLPGYAEAVARSWGGALVALLVPAALLALPLVERAGFRLPWLLVPHGRLTPWIAAAGLLLWALIRYWRHGRAAV